MRVLLILSLFFSCALKQPGSKYFGELSSMESTEFEEKGLSKTFSDIPFLNASNFLIESISVVEIAFGNNSFYQSHFKRILDLSHPSIAPPFF